MPAGIKLRVYAEDSSVQKNCEHCACFIFCWPCISVQFVLITNLTHFF